MHKKPGYVLFLLFSILSVCMVLMSMFFSRTMMYRQLMNQLIRQEQATLLNLSSMSMAKAILFPDSDDAKKTNSPETKSEEKAGPEKTFVAVYPYFNKEKTHELIENIDGVQATLTMSIQSEHGKINLNSFYDYKNKKFFGEGQKEDKKKLCIWLFDQIATVTGKTNLFAPFEQHLKQRTHCFNDVCELLTIAEFSEQFHDSLFVDFSATSKKKKLFLTDIFTIYTQKNEIHPLLLSASCCTLLGLQPKATLPEEELQKLMTALKNPESVETLWNKSLKSFYQKEYKDLPQEIKSILTTRYEANIFSLLLKTKMVDTVSSIFAVVNMNTKQHLIDFDIIKTYQI